VITAKAVFTGVRAKAVFTVIPAQAGNQEESWDRETPWVPDQLRYDGKAKKCGPLIGSGMMIMITYRR